MSPALTTVSRLARALPVPAGAGAARMLVERNTRAFRSRWLVLLSGFFEPVFYLFSLGVGLGSVVGQVDAGDGHLVDYAVFVAPALLASSAMNGAVFDTTGNVFFKLKYARLYDVVLATPLGPRDVAVGEVTWALLRGSVYAAMFLFAGTFFPVDQLPVWTRPLVWATPLWHGTEAARQLTLGTPHWPAIAGHCAYLLLWTGVGLVLAVRSFTRRLLT